VSPDQVFSIVNLVALATWVLLAAFPRHTGVLAGTAVPAAFAAVYAVIIAAKIGSSTGGFSSLSDVAMLFSDPWLLLAGWIHYLAFDLFVGSWEVRDAQEHGIPHPLVLPSLVLTFLFGPAGWILYLGVRFAHRQGRQGV
jgi:hypothetical protein